MSELGGRSRSSFRFPRVEFDLSGLVVGMVGYVVYQWSWTALAQVLGAPAAVQRGIEVSGGRILKWEFFGQVMSGLRLPHQEWVFQRLGWPGVWLERSGDSFTQRLDPHVFHLEWWGYAVVGVWMLLFVGLFGGALSRVYAVRIARDESVPALDALGFSLGHLRSYLLAPLFVVAAAGFFLLLNAAAGAVAAVPVAGPVLQIVLHPLALLSGLVVTVIALGAVFGFPVTLAALSTERNGTLDAISRTYSYVFTRPLTYVSGSLVILVVAAIVLVFGDWFLKVTYTTLDWGAGWNESAARGLKSGTAAGGVLSVMLGFAGPPPGADVTTTLAHYVSMLWAFVGRVAVAGFALSYVVGGFTDLYFLLRGEVDGIDDTEVFVEGETASLGDPLPGEPSGPDAGGSDAAA